MEIHERIQELRKILGLSRKAFGEKIGVSENVIVNIELNRLRKPKQKEPIYILICKEFRVNYYWLRDGIGDMFIGTPQTIVEEIAEEYDLDDIDKRILEKYLELSKEKREVIKEYFKSIFIEEKTED